MDATLIFDTIHAAEPAELNPTDGGERHNFAVRLRSLVDGEVTGEAMIRAHMNGSDYVQAQTPVPEYVRRSVERLAGCENDGRKLERLIERIEAAGGSLRIPPPSDPHDAGQPLKPRATLPPGFGG